MTTPYRGPATLMGQRPVADLFAELRFLPRWEPNTSVPRNYGQFVSARALSWRDQYKSVLYAIPTGAVHEALDAPFRNATSFEVIDRPEEGVALVIGHGPSFMWRSYVATVDLTEWHAAVAAAPTRPAPSNPKV